MKRTFPHRLSALIALFLSLGVSACGEEGDYLEIKGGGFIFNYRIGEAHYGLVAEARRDLPEGSVVEAVFEDPSGGEPIRLEKAARPGQRRFVFDTPPVRGVEAETSYEVTLRVLPGDGSGVLEMHRRSFTSNVSQTVLPDAPLTIGPGYARNPATPAN